MMTMTWMYYCSVVVMTFLAQSSQILAFSLLSRPTGSARTTTINTALQWVKSEPSRSHLRKQFGVLYMGWGPEPIWTDATIVKPILPACESQKSVLVQIKVPAETAVMYKVPGQYVQVRPATNDDTVKPLFLAMASGPPQVATAEGDAVDTVFEFLIKCNENNVWLTTLPSDGTVQVSQVLGNGFPIEENLNSFKYDFPTQNIVLFATGSGIAPIVATIRSQQLLLNGGSGRTCRLYYGERSAADLCYIDQYTLWEEMGVQVVPVLSAANNDNDDTTDPTNPDSTAWYGRTGYVQTAFVEDGLAVPRNSGALMCGVKGMTEAVKDLLVRAGVFEGRILTNF